MFPNRVPTDRDTLSTEPLAKRRDSIHSFMYVCQSPQNEPSYIHTGKKYGHRPWGPTQTKGLHTMGCSLVPQGDR